jgi:hypothetical protein
METINTKEIKTNPILNKTVEPDTDLKNMLVEYVGNTLDPENREVTVEMIIEVMAKEFPEFLLSMAEENWIRGYQQALNDVEIGKSFAEKEIKNEQKKNCKLCEKAE